MSIDVLKTVYVGNGVAILLLLILLIGGSWNTFSHSKENKHLRNMLLFTIGCCIMDPLVYTVDGKAGLLFTIIIYFGNSWLYIGDAIVGYIWVKLLEKFLDTKLSRTHDVILKAVLCFSFICLIVNIFVPIVFKAPGNVYERCGFYWVFLLVAIIYIVDGLVLYLKVKKTSGALKYFPVELFIIPIVVGVVIQSLFYGVSTIWPCVAIGLTGVISSIQRSKIVFDTLTGIYNRFYLEYHKKRLVNNDKAEITGVMIDLNDFKNINDEFGHATGDEALIATGEILTKAVSEYGIAIRYAGDEFIILINSIDKDIVNKCIKNIRQMFVEYNARSGKPYKLSAAIGYAPLNLTTQSMSEFMNIIDEKMYEDKRVSKAKAQQE